MISLFKKNSYKWKAAPVIILVALGCVLLTNGRSSSKPINNGIPEDVQSGIIKNGSSKENSVSEFDIKAGNFSGKMLVVTDPKKIAVGFSKQILQSGEATSEMAKDNNAICSINAGGFKNADANGKIEPAGIIIHNGGIIYSDLKYKNEKFDTVGFKEDGTLIVGKHTMDELNQIGVKEAVSFGPALIINGKPQITEGDGGWGVGPRTAIGQKADGTILLITIDGRSKESVGATLSELQDILIKNGAVNASNLDGGSSSTMYYNGKVINHPSYASGERAVSSAFVVLP